MIYPNVQKSITYSQYEAYYAQTAVEFPSLRYRPNAERKHSTVVYLVYLKQASTLHIITPSSLSIFQRTNSYNEIKTITYTVLFIFVDC